MPRVTCPHCGQRFHTRRPESGNFEVHGRLRGQTIVTCGNCRHEIVVTRFGKAAPSSAEALLWKHFDSPEAEALWETDPVEAGRRLEEDPDWRAVKPMSLHEFIPRSWRLALWIVELPARFRRAVRGALSLELAASALSPKERLWRQVGYLFTDPDTYHPGPDVDFMELAPTEVDLMARRLLRDVDSLDPMGCAGIFDEDGDDVDPSEALARHEFAPRVAEFHGRLDRVIADDVVLPPLGFNMWADRVSLFWWVGVEDDWNQDQVAAFVALIGELKALAPNVRLRLEWKDDERRFFRAVDRYLEAHT